MPIQQMLLGAGASSKTYIDDVFSNYVWNGTGSSRAISNGINLSGKGGMVWIKKREGGSISQNSALADTERTAGNGNPQYLNTNTTGIQENSSSLFSGWNSDGFDIGGSDLVNGNYSNPTYASWSFRKSSGFFDVVTYTGNGSNRTISHSLGSVPGMVIVKCLDEEEDWYVVHRSLGGGKYLKFSDNGDASNSSTHWNNTIPTASAFSLGTDDATNKNNNEYVAYVFAGGKADATDKAVSFDGTDDKLTWAATSDFTFGTGAYTVEYWIYYDNLTDGSVVFSQYTDSNGGFVIASTTGKVAINSFGVGDVVAYNTAPATGEWIHYAFVRESTSSNKTYIFVNGELKQTGTDTTDWNTTQISALGGNAHPTSTQYTDCKISNFRITKGQALYTTNFNVPHDPLTTESQGAEPDNVKVICCNGDTTTASTKTPGTITAVSSPSMSTNNSIFDDTSANVFGADGDKGIIKTGMYVGNGSATAGATIHLEFEPQFIMIKRTDASASWAVFDDIRGMVTSGYDPVLQTDLADLEYTTTNYLDVNPRGFQLKLTANQGNADGGDYIYVAIRRPDGLVGKPPQAGTGVFAMDTGSGSAGIPVYDSGFPVDLALYKEFAATASWNLFTRLTSPNQLNTNNNTAQQSDGGGKFDSNEGWYKNSMSSAFQSWMWKRHAGFDVVTWAGTNTSVVRRHNLGKTPEMIWFKNRDDTRNWKVYHKGLNGGTNPEDYTIDLNQTNSEASNTSYMTGTAPTSTTFVSGNDGDTNGYGDNYIALLFASVDGISKVGYYAGTTSNLTITTGFQPRFVIIKNITISDSWYVLDTTRGWGSGDDEYLQLNSTAAQVAHDFGAPTSTGFTLGYNNGAYNNNGNNFIYYAHA